MVLPADHPAREGERLRSILTTLAYASPGMSLDEAVQIIWDIEKRTAELERTKEPEVSDISRAFNLPAVDPETLATFIDLMPSIQSEIDGGVKITAIKSLRASACFKGTYVGLKDAKEGVEHWQNTRRSSPTVVGPSTPPPMPTVRRTTSSSTKTQEEIIADWIGSADPKARPARVYLDAAVTCKATGVSSSSNIIQGIKEVRANCPEAPSLTEAKYGAEEYMRRVRSTSYYS